MRFAYSKQLIQHHSFINSFLCYIIIFLIEFETNEITPIPICHDSSRRTPHKGVKNQITLIAPRLDMVFREFIRKCRWVSTSLTTDRITKNIRMNLLILCYENFLSVSSHRLLTVKRPTARFSVGFDTTSTLARNLDWIERLWSSFRKHEHIFKTLFIATMCQRDVISLLINHSIV